MAAVAGNWFRFADVGRVAVFIKELMEVGESQWGVGGGWWGFAHHITN